MANGIWVDPNTFKALKDKPSTVLTGGELATRQNSPYNFTLMGHLPDPDSVLRKSGKDISVYRELLGDAHVWSCYTQRKAGVLSLDWDIDRGTAKSKQSKAIKKIFESQKLYQLTSNVLDSLFFGYQPFEIVWGKTADGILQPNKIEAKPQEWFSYNDKNELVLDFGNRTKSEPVPHYQFLVARHQPSYLNPYGEKLLAKVFWSVTFKRGGLKFWVKFTEKYGMPQLIGKVPRGTTEPIMEDLRDKLEDMIQDAVAVIFDDQSIDISKDGVTTASADIYDKLIKYCDSEISKAILTQTLTTQPGDSGSYALGKEQGRQLGLVSKGDVELVTEFYQEFINCWDELNYRSTDIPKFILFEEDDVDKELAERDSILTEKLGVRFSKSYIEKTYFLSSDDFELDTGTTPAPGVNVAELSEKSKSIDFKDTKTDDENSFPDQVAIDKLIESFSNEKQQTLIEPVMKKLIAMVQSAESFDDVREKLADIYSEMDDSGVEKLMEKVIFLAETFGRISTDL